MLEKKEALKEGPLNIKEAGLTSSGNSHLLQAPEDANIKKWLQSTVRKM